MKEIKVIIGLILILFCYDVYPQSIIKDELSQIRTKYNSVGNMDLIIDYNIYASDSSKDVLENQQAKIYKRDEYQVVDFLGTRTWYGDHFTLMLIEKEQKAILSNPVENKNEAFLPGISLDSLFNAFDIKRDVLEATSQINYTLEIPGNFNFPFREIKMTAGKDHLLNKMILSCRYPLSYYGLCSDCTQNTPKIELSFDYLNNLKDITDIKNIENCLVRNNGKYTLSGRLKGYDLVNLSSLQ